MVSKNISALSKHRAGLIALLLCCTLISGCGYLSTQKEFYKPIVAELHEGNYEAAVDKIEAAREKGKFKKKDRFLYFLDAGLAYHYALRYDVSNMKLTDAEKAGDELFTRSISRAAASLLLNDNILEYAGEDYEILYTNLFMALNYISLNMFDDAFVEIRRANEKLDLLEQKYADAAGRFQEESRNDSAEVEIEYKAKKVRFNNDAFARYLSMHIYAAEGLYDDARIDYNWLYRAFREQPHIYGFDAPEVLYYSENSAVLSVVALAGLSPVKEALNLRIRTDKDLDLVQVLYTDPKQQDNVYDHFPMPVSEDYYFKFSIPQIVPRPSFIDKIAVYADDRFLGYLQLIEDVGSVAKETFEAKKSLIYLRTIARAVVKGLAAHKAKEKSDDGNLGGWLKKALIDVGTDISENADLRCSRLLPGKIHVGDFELTPGTYNLKVKFLNEYDEIISRREIPDYKIIKSGLNLIEVFSLN